MYRITKNQKLKEKLESLRVNEKLSIKDTIKEIWKLDCEYHPFIVRSFDVFFSKNRSLLKEKNYEFIRKKGEIIRIA